MEETEGDWAIVATGESGTEARPGREYSIARATARAFQEARSVTLYWEKGAHLGELSPRENRLCFGHGLSWSAAIIEARETYLRMYGDDEISFRLVQRAINNLRVKLGEVRVASRLVYTHHEDGDHILLLSSEGVVVSEWKATPELLGRFLDDSQDPCDWEVQNIEGVEPSRADDYGEIVAFRTDDGLGKTPEFSVIAESMLRSEHSG